MALTVSLPRAASAAPPDFELEAIAGEGALTVTLTFEAVPDGFAWDAMESSGVLDELVGVMPSDQVDENGRPTGVATPMLVTLERISDGVYRGDVPLPQPGTWAVVPWPLAPDLDPAASTEIIRIGVRPLPTLWAMVGLTAIGLVVFAWSKPILRLLRAPPDRTG